MTIEERTFGKVEKIAPWRPIRYRDVAPMLAPIFVQHSIGPGCARIGWMA